jgi:hypothetical protein
LAADAGAWSAPAADTPLRMQAQQARCQARPYCPPLMPVAPSMVRALCTACPHTEGEHPALACFALHGKGQHAPSKSKGCLQHAPWDPARAAPHQQADAALVVGAGLRDVAVPARVAPPRIFMWMCVAAVLPGVRRLDGARLDLQRSAIIVAVSDAAVSQQDTGPQAAAAPVFASLGRRPSPRCSLAAGASAWHSVLDGPAAFKQLRGAPPGVWDGLLHNQGSPLLITS